MSTKHHGDKHPFQKKMNITPIDHDVLQLMKMQVNGV
jgi:hypothetical protein